MSATAANNLADAAKPKKGRKKLVLLAVPALLVVAGGGLWFSGILSGHKAPAEADKHESHGPIFVEIPEIVANLNAGSRRTSFVKLKVKLEVHRSEDQAAALVAMPRLLDLFQTYLRETRPEELRGSAATYRLREELLNRADVAIAPGHVSDVLFTEILVQ